LNELNT
jgi:hypothetical protein